MLANQCKHIMKAYKFCCLRSFNRLLDHSKSKYSNFIGYLQVSIFCRSLVHVSIDPRLCKRCKAQNCVPVTKAMHGHLIRLEVVPILFKEVVTSILPVKNLGLRSRFNQVIKALFYSKSRDQDAHESSN